MPKTPTLLRLTPAGDGLNFSQPVNLLLTSAR